MTPFVDDQDFTLYQGDVLEVLAGLPAESVHCCVTSPPYWGLRDYGSEGQLGLEPTPEEYVANMVSVFREVRRVLRRDGTCWLNIGDSYATNGTEKGSGNASETRETGMHGSFKVTPSSLRDRQAALPNQRPNGLKPKDLVGIPWRLAFALQADGWYLRSDIIWSKSNPMPESVTDRPTKAHEYLFLLTKSARYFYDADSIREQAEWARWGDQTNGKHEGQGSAAGWIGAKSKDELQGKYANPGNRTTNGPRSTERRHETAGFSQRLVSADGGKNKRTVWEIATEPYPDAHFATFPQALVEPCVLAGTSERGCCPECGAPWERETDVSYEKSPVHGSGSVVGRHYETGANNYDGAGMPRLNKVVETTGWRPSCDCGDEQAVIGQVGTVAHESVPCTVLDPFMGSGTTALVARRHGRRSVGVELNPDYCALTARRLQQLSLLAA